MNAEEQFDALMQAATNRLNLHEVNLLREQKDMLVEMRLLLPSVIKLLNIEQLTQSKVPLGVAVLLAKAFPGRSSFSCVCCCMNPLQPSVIIF
jgi:hypothetical protein